MLLHRAGRLVCLIFLRASSGVELLKLRASDGTPGDYFGLPAISGNRVIIGATGFDGVGQNSGAVYVFFIPEPSCGILSALAITGLATYLVARPKRCRKDKSCPE